VLLPNRDAFSHTGLAKRYMRVKGARIEYFELARELLLKPAVWLMTGRDEETKRKRNVCGNGENGGTRLSSYSVVFCWCKTIYILIYSTVYVVRACYVS